MALQPSLGTDCFQDLFSISFCPTPFVSSSDTSQPQIQLGGLSVPERTLCSRGRSSLSPKNQTLADKTVVNILSQSGRTDPETNISATTRAIIGTLTTELPLICRTGRIVRPNARGHSVWSERLRA
jgi:hypothetical protein